MRAFSIYSGIKGGNFRRNIENQQNAERRYKMGKKDKNEKRRKTWKTELKAGC